MAIGSAESGVHTMNVPVPSVEREPSAAERCLKLANEFYERMSKGMEAAGIPTNRHIPARAFVDEGGEITTVISHNTPDTTPQISEFPVRLLS